MRPRIFTWTNDQVTEMPETHATMEVVLTIGQKYFRSCNWTLIIKNLYWSYRLIFFKDLNAGVLSILLFWDFNLTNAVLKSFVWSCNRFTELIRHQKIPQSDTLITFWQIGKKENDSNERFHDKLRNRCVRNLLSKTFFVVVLRKKEGAADNQPIITD